jgi:hypothetical protein
MKKPVTFTAAKIVVAELQPAFAANVLFTMVTAKFRFNHRMPVTKIYRHAEFIIFLLMIAARQF